MGTLSEKEKTMVLEGFVRVANGSGEDYENAQVRLLVGKIHLIDRIADLARRQYPYGSPRPPEATAMPEAVGRMAPMAEAKDAFRLAERQLAARPKEIKKEGLSEYFLYTIEGTETVPNAWSKRLPSFQVQAVPVVNLYKYEKERHAEQVVRFLRFKNDKAHKLGQTPIPGGLIKVYRNLDGTGLLAYEGQSRFKYIPVDEDVELALGPVANVIVKPTLMEEKTEKYLFDEKGNVSGWDEIRTVQIEAKNTRSIPVQVEITRNFSTSSWNIKPDGDFGDYEKVDLDTVRFTLNLDADQVKNFTYILTIHHGKSAE
jgi:hypothetical protein